MGITGTVRNLPNGHVEIHAHGSKKRLEELMQRLTEEVGPAQIEEANIEYFPIDNPMRISALFINRGQKNGLMVGHNKYSNSS